MKRKRLREQQFGFRAPIEWQHGDSLPVFTSKNAFDWAPVRVGGRDSSRGGTLADSGRETRSPIVGIRKSGRPWYDRAEFISTELFGSLCSDIIKEYSVV